MNNNRSYKLGKKPARPGAVSLTLKSVSSLPAPPSTFGHYALIESWGMLKNDDLGDCGIAGPEHETMAWAATAGKSVSFDDASTIKNYEAISGYDPSDPNSDGGTDMAHCAAYRKKSGILDAAGNRHKIAAYLAITPKHVDEHKTAAWMFGAVGIGIEFPAFAMDQFNAGEPWDVSHHNTKIDGGHYIPIVGFDGTYFLVVTWGKLQKMTPAFLEKYNDESYAYVSCEMFNDPQSPQIAQLVANLKQLKAIA